MHCMLGEAANKTNDQFQVQTQPPRNKNIRTQSYCDNKQREVFTFTAGYGELLMYLEIVYLHDQFSVRLRPVARKLV